MPTSPGSYTSYIAPKDITIESRRMIDRLSGEMGSGRKSDIGQAVASDFSTLSRLFNEIETFSARRSGLLQAQTWTAAGQAAHSSIYALIESLAEKLPVTLTPLGLSDPSVIGASGRGALVDIVNGLNTMVGGRAVFGNGGTDSPLAPPETLLAEIATLAGSSADLASYEADLDAYFAIGGGFDTSILRVTKTTPVVFPDGEGAQIELDTSSGDSEFRSALRQAAFFAGLPYVSFPASDILDSGQAPTIIADIQDAKSGLVNGQARLGVAEEAIKRGLTRISEAQLSAEIDLANLTKVDEYETASQLQNEFTRLESLYAITARRAQLNLTSFLR